MKVNETHVHAVCEKIKVLHYFRFATEGLVFFLLISISHILDMSQFGINFVHVINFSNVQNVLCISVMYMMSSLEYLCIGGWGLEWILPWVLKSLSMVCCQNKQSMPSRQWRKWKFEPGGKLS